MPRIADRADQASLEVRASANEIDNFIGFRIEEHPVDREIAARRVFRRRREMHFRRTAAIKVDAVRAEGRDLELKSILKHDDHTKVRAHRVGP